MTRRSAVTALAIVAALGLAACSDSGDDGGGDAGGGSTPTEEATQDATGGETAASEGDTQAVFDIGLGDCISDFQVQQQVSELAVIPCEEPHSQEVFAIFEAPDGDFPGAEAFRDQVERDCVGAFEGFVGVPHNRSTLEIKWLQPTEESWNSGDHQLVCTVLDPSGPVTGTLEGASR